MVKNYKNFYNLSKKIFNKNGKYINNELRYILEYLDSENEKNDKYPWTSRLEKAFAKKFKAKFAISHNSGTSTLHSCLHALDLKSGDEVIGPVQTGIWFAFVCIHQNVVPIYVDSDPETFLMDPNKIEEKITKKTKVIIATHMHGCPSDMDKIMKIAKKHKIYVIEDCAQSYLATYKGKLTGTIGHMASFSFETKKHMSTGQGGMVITNNAKFAKKIRQHAGLGYKTLTPAQGMTSLKPHEFQNPYFLRHDSIGYNYRLPEICAAVGLAQLEVIEKKVKSRVAIANEYYKVIKNTKWLVPQKIPKNCTSTYWTYPVMYLGENYFDLKWEDFYNLFKKNGGDGFYGCLALQTDEIVIKKKKYLNYLSHFPKNVLKKFEDNSNNYPIAKSIQPLIMQFKCGYRNKKDLEKNILALKKTIDDVQND